MPLISVYTFRWHQQSTTLRPQNCDYFYLKFCAEYNALGLFFQQEK